jgi:hypothetical protein
MDAQAKLAKVILKRVRETDPLLWIASGDIEHMRTCMDAWVDNPQYIEGQCDFDTCYWTALQAIITCPHEKRLDFVYESSDTVDELFAEMDKM